MEPGLPVPANSESVPSATRDQTYVAGISLILFFPGDNVNLPRLFTDTFCNFPFEMSTGSVFAHILVVTA